MKRVKFIHTADVHLKSDNDIIFEAFIDIVYQAKTEEVDFLLIAGDLFEDFIVAPSLLDRVTKLFDYLKPIKVFISPGNHDPLKANSPYLSHPFPDNVFIFTASFSYFEIDKVRIYGRAFANHFEEESLLKKVDLDSNYINILLMHGQISNLSIYNPISYFDLMKDEYDYVALGHLHRLFITDHFVYPGTPQARGFDEKGDSGYMYVEIEGEEKKIEFRELNKEVYHSIDISVEDDWQSHDLIKTIKDQCPSLNDHYRLNINGNITSLYDLGIIESILKKKYAYLEIIDKRKELIDYDALKKEVSLKGIFVRTLLEKIEKAEDKEILEEALRLGLKAFEEDIEI